MENTVALALSVKRTQEDPNGEQSNSAGNGMRGSLQ